MYNLDDLVSLSPYISDVEELPKCGCSGNHLVDVFPHHVELHHHSHDVSESLKYASGPHDICWLLTKNYLREFKTPKEKAMARANLGIDCLIDMLWKEIKKLKPGTGGNYEIPWDEIVDYIDEKLRNYIKVVNWGDIKGDIFKQTDLIEYVKSQITWDNITGDPATNNDLRLFILSLIPEIPEYIKIGGLWSVLSLDTIDKEIPMALREEGMMAYVIDKKSYYSWIEGEWIIFFHPAKLYGLLIYIDLTGGESIYPGEEKTITCYVVDQYMNEYNKLVNKWELLRVSSEGDEEDLNWNLTSEQARGFVKTGVFKISYEELGYVYWNHSVKFIIKAYIADEVISMEYVVDDTYRN